MIFSRMDRSPLGQWWWTVDRPTLVAVLSLIVIGIVMVATASPPVAERIGLDSFYFLKRHLIFLMPSVVVMIGASLLSPRWLWRISSLALPCIFALLVVVLFAGMEVKGSRRWLSMASLSLQPSEFLKPVFAIAAAWCMAQSKIKGNRAGTLASIALYGLSLVLLITQPDFGMTFLITVMWATQIFLAGLPLRFVAGLVGLLVAVAGLAYATLDHVKSRVDRFIDPSKGDNYQVEQSLEAFRSGGLIGTGPGQGQIKLHLPDAHADFTFAVAGEEMGVIAALTIAGLFLFIVLRSVSRVMDSDDMFAVLGAGGLLAMLGVQAFIHMGSALSILPAKGMTLPFISYGGSSTLAIGFAVGALLCLTRRKKKETPR